MEFKLSITSDFTTNERKIKYEKLGFNFEVNEWHYNADREPWVKQGQSFYPLIEINTLEELINFVREYGQIVLNDGEIEIYDDYR